MVRQPQAYDAHQRPLGFDRGTPIDRYFIRCFLDEHRADVRAGGVVLLTAPAVSRIDRATGVDREFWRFTTAGCATLLGQTFGSANVTVRAYGNVLTAAAFLMGSAAEDLSRRELDHRDEFFPVLVAARAVKP